ncbi:hypothetical protein BB560_003147 [Smittium megazygosporum]|uniref:Uncharacterized protein n=1 Tax=Smittium megazygosporum TaxID=133381 RepID=A0A2T9ZCW5_9FUNG|nr:hypothetical protein BB560_003147 [Smittium megazygosporum]
MSAQNQLDKKQIEAMIAQKKAEVMKKFASMSKANSGSTIQSPLVSKTTNNPPPANESSSKLNIDFIQAQIANAAAQARLRANNVMQNTQNLRNQSSISQNQSNSTLSQTENSSLPRGGLNAELHPMLKRNLNDPSPSGNQNKRRKNLALLPKFSTIKANQAKVTSEYRKPTPNSFLNKAVSSSGPSSQNKPSNPYLSHVYSAENRQGSEIPLPSPLNAQPKGRNRKGLNFVRHGTYIHMAEKMRSQARLEEMKKKIAEQMEKTGLQLEMMEADESLLVQKNPPEVEWWDAPLLRNPNYNDVFTLVNSIGISAEVKSAPITHLIQHPVPIPPPSTMTQVIAPKTLMLTKKEHKKLRRQRRQEELKDKREKIQMGLLPPEQPKLRISNLMNVMGAQAIQDPTKMEALARAQMQQRKAAHLKANAERKLSKEERKEKVVQKEKQDISKGVYTCVYKIGNLDNPKLRFKVNINAQQLSLSGILVIFSGFCLVVVEGGMRAINSYKKLMLRRMNWKEPALVLDPENQSTNNTSNPNLGKTDSAEQKDPILRSSKNFCSLVWEGQIPAKKFKSFKVKQCPTEAFAKSLLSRADIESYWDLAKSFVGSTSV